MTQRLLQEKAQKQDSGLRCVWSVFSLNHGMLSEGAAEDYGHLGDLIRSRRTPSGARRWLRARVGHGREGGKDLGSDPGEKRVPRTQRRTCFRVRKDSHYFLWFAYTRCLN